jgi:DNA-binding CsgD family transcriptional regulator
MFNIAEIYEAAMLPEYWPAVLSGVCKQSGVDGATVVTVDDMPRWTTSIGMHENMRRYIDEGWHTKNEPMARLVQRMLPGFVREIDLFTFEELDIMPIIKDFKRPGGFGWSAAMATSMPTGEMLLFSVEQRFERGPLTDAAIAQLEELRPHLARSALLAAKLQHQRAEAGVQALENSGVPAALVTHRGRVLAANESLLALGESVTTGAGDKLVVRSKTAATLLQQALQQLSSEPANRAPMSIAVPSTTSEPPLVIHIVPTKGRAQDLFGSLTALLIVTKVQSSSGPPASLLRALFDLTPAESRVAEAVLSGEDKASLQRRLSINDETERTHVKAILRKAGVKRRVDLINLFKGFCV